MSLNETDQSNPNPGTGNVSAAKPNAARILQGMPDGNSPMDILNAIVSRESPNTIVIRPPESSTPPTDKETFVAPPEKQIPKEPDAVPDLNKELNIEGDYSIPGENKIADDKELNFRKLSKSLNETQKTLKEKEDELKARDEKIAEREKEIEDYKTGKIFPDVVIEKENRIKELERYEKIHALKSSPQWVETRVKPMQEKKERMLAVAAEYEIPPEEAQQVINKALSIDNPADRSRFLSSHFEDIDALEVKTLIKDYHSLAQEARQAEIEPEKILQELTQQTQQINHDKEVKRRSTIAQKAEKGWIDSLLKIREEGKILEFIPKADDKEYNEKYIDPIQKAASTEFGKLIANLTELGLPDLPEELSTGLAKMVQLAHASALSIETRSTAVSAAQELMKNTRRMNNFIRPPVGQQQAPGNGSGPTPRSETRESRIEGLLQTGREAARK